jgi:hypothetical protein
MIQRIQSLFLFLSAILLFILFWFPLAVLQLDNETFYEIYTKGYIIDENVEYSYSLLIFNGITFLLSLIIIILYKNRILQMRLCIYNFILILGFQGIIFYAIYATAMNLKAETFLEYYAILPAIAAILHFISFMYIKRDEELVKSADRIR